MPLPDSEQPSVMRELDPSRREISQGTDHLSSSTDLRSLQMFASSTTTSIVLLMLLSFAASIAGATETAGTATERSIDLAGTWSVLLDPENTFDPATLGVTDTTNNKPTFVPVRLPGTLQESELGDRPGPETHWIAEKRDAAWQSPRFAAYNTADNFKFPFWLQPNRHFVGQAWYQRPIEIPESWKGERIVLHLERPHWQTQVWIDGQSVGQNDSLGTPHEYDITTFATRGPHTLTIGVNNDLASVDVGKNAHSVSDHTQSAWHGIVGNMMLLSRPRLSINRAQANDVPAQRACEVHLNFTNVTGEPQGLSLSYQIHQDAQLMATSTINRVIPIGDSIDVDAIVPWTALPKRWDEFDPSMCRLTVKVEANMEGTELTQLLDFGIRDLQIADHQFVLNGIPIFLRGTLESCIFPLTGYPPTNVDAWLRIMRTCKQHGLNHIRFHSWCPPEAAFAAADQIGIYLQIECGSWANQGASLGLGNSVDGWLEREAERVLASYGHHPSFLLFAAGNEPSGPDRGAKYLTPWIGKQTPHRSGVMVTGGSGWPMIRANEYHVTSAPRIHQWGDELRSRINAKPPETETDYREFVNRTTAPLVSHETGQWCAFPNIHDTAKYTGVLKAKSLEIIRDFLDAKGMLDQADDFVMASGKLQAICYKEDIESCLRTPNLGGFQLLDLHDFPGQGTAPVGVLDAFWDPKPYINADEFRRFCGPIVPLARFPKRIWRQDETISVPIEVAHYGPKPMLDAKVRWQITRAEKPIQSGEFELAEILNGGIRSLGTIHVDLSSLLRWNDACELNLAVQISAAQMPEEQVGNNWSFWVYPTLASQTTSSSDPSPSNDVLLTDQWDDETVERLKNGGKVLFTPKPNSIDTNVTLGFSPIFWNLIWSGRQPPHTLGLLCNPKHPALADFPTAGHSDWQWWPIVTHAAAMSLDHMPKMLRPIVQVVPDWFEPQRLGLVFEAKCLGGKVLVCSIDLGIDRLATQPPSREANHDAVIHQLRTSLTRYLASDSFDPQIEVTADQIRSLQNRPSTLVAMGATATCDSQQKNFSPDFAIDGDVATLWHTAWTPTPGLLPHWLEVDMKTDQLISGVRCRPRTDAQPGRIQHFKILTSSDATTWTPMREGRWWRDDHRQDVWFKSPVSARYVRLVALSEVAGRQITSLAEFDVILADSMTVAQFETSVLLDQPQTANK